VGSPFIFNGTNAKALTSTASVNNFLQGYTTTATAAGTTTLDVTSTNQQFFTGTTTQTVKLPVASTLVLGQQYRFVNLSTGNVTVQSSGANTIQVMDASSQLIVTCILTSGTGTASWSATYYPLAATGTVAFSAYGSTTAASTTACFVFTTVDFDTTSSYSTTTGKWTAPYAGVYAVFGQAYSGGNFTAFIYKNSSSYSQGTPQASAAQASFVYNVLKLDANDVIEIRPDASVTASSSTSSNRISRFSIARLGL
jgi:hypothetical protein